MAETRRRTLSLVDPVEEADIERVHCDLLSPLVWDLGHIAAFEDLWLAHEVGGLEPLRPELMDVYDATETPRAKRGELPLLHLAEAREYLDAVRERALGVLARADLSGGADTLTAGGFAWELVIEHEQQHSETMLQTLRIAEPGVFTPSPPPAAPLPAPRVPARVRIDAGPVRLGAGDGGFAYDNERPLHEAELAAFEIDTTAVTNAAYLDFVESGGYARREWWTDAGWRWRTEHGIERPLYWTADGCERRFDRLDPLDPSEPVMHVSWFEADAFARAHGMRLPTEAEWERAALGPPTKRRSFPWGDGAPDPSRANVDQAAFGPAPAAAHPAGASPDGVLGMIGDAWEWTASDFGPYPGFRAYPYEEYSAIFFGGGLKVLRGASWATRAAVARTTFRNWDFPDRRQIFAGFRCARDA